VQNKFVRPPQTQHLVIRQEKYLKCYIREF